MILRRMMTSATWRWRRWRAGTFLRKLRKMLFKLNDKLRSAGFTRHERRRISREILKNIESAVSTFLKE